MKKLSMTVFTVICTLLFTFSLIMMADVNIASADTMGTQPTLSATKVMRSKNNDKLLLATAIKDFDDVYEIGYNFDDEVVTIHDETNKYYTAISNGQKTWYPSDIFEEEWASGENVGIIIWEIELKIGTTYSFKPYAVYGDRNEQGGLVPAAHTAAPETATAKTYYTVTIDSDGGSGAPESVVVPSGTQASALDSITLTKTGYHYDAWEYYIDEEWESLDPATTVTENVTVRPAWEINTYTITFKNFDGTVLQSGSVNYNVVPSYAGTPEMADDAQYTYGEFTGWDNEIVAATENATYIATYNNKVLNSYNIIFYSAENVEYSTDSYNYGATFNIPSDPAILGKTFLGWKVRVGTEGGEPVWDEEYYDFSEENATFVSGEKEFLADWGDYIQLAGTSALNNYSLGDMLIAQVDTANAGKYADITMRIKLAGDMATSNHLWTRYLSDSNTWTQLTAPASASTYSDYTEISFYSYIPEDGKIYINARNNSDSQETYDVRVIDVTINSILENYARYSVNHTERAGSNAYWLRDQAIFDAATFNNEAVVLVTMTIKCSGVDVTNGKFVIQCVNGGGTIESLIPAAKISGYTDWTVIKFVTKVGFATNNNAAVDKEDTNIYLQFRRSDGSAGTTVVEIKDILVSSVDYTTYQKFSGTASSGGYTIGDKVIATTESASPVQVKILMKFSGAISNNGKLWTQYFNESNKDTQLTAPNTATNLTYQTWQEVTFTSYVDSGNIKLRLKNNGGSGTYNVEIIVLSVE